MRSLQSKYLVQADYVGTERWQKYCVLVLDPLLCCDNPVHENSRMQNVIGQYLNDIKYEERKLAED
jgi:hypothetical protein